MTDTEIEIERAEQRAVERALGCVIRVLREMRDEGDARSGEFERFEQKLRAALEYERTKSR